MCCVCNWFVEKKKKKLFSQFVSVFRLGLSEDRAACRRSIALLNSANGPVPCKNGPPTTLIEPGM